MPIVLQKKGCRYWLLSFEERFYLVRADETVPKETEQRLQSGACREDDIKAMGLSFETIPKKNMRSVTIGGCEAGDRILLTVKKASRSFALARACRMEELEVCFAGIEQKKKRHSHVDFRRDLQSEEGLKAAVRVGLVLNLTAAVLALAIVLSDASDKLWTSIGMAVSLVSLAAYLAYPQYYSMFDEGGRKKFGYTAKAWCIGIGAAGPWMAMCMKMIDAYHIEAWAIPALAILAITAVITLLLCRFVRELRDTGAAWVAIAIMVLFCVTGAVGQINHLFNPRTADPAEQYTVEETSHSIGRHLYYCTVRPEVGHSRELPISFVTYLRLQEGDRVLLYQGKGALGIEYAYVIPIQS